MTQKKALEIAEKKLLEYRENYLHYRDLLMFQKALINAIRENSDWQQAVSIYIRQIFNEIGLNSNEQLFELEDLIGLVRAETKN